MYSPHARRRALLVPSSITGVVVAIGVFGILTLTGVAAAPAPAQAADVTNVTSSAVTVTAAQQDSDAADSPFPNLSVTVSQTKDLLAQGLTISWAGGKKSTLPSSQTGGENFLQVMQCWGDDPNNPGQPDRTTCQYGGFVSAGDTRDYSIGGTDPAPEDAQYTVPSDGFFSPGYTSIPFRSNTGDVVASVVNGKKTSTNVNTNQFFTAYTTNEVKWAGSSSDGTGSVKFEVQTAQQSPGLGCGAPLQQADGSVIGQSCWLVVIPRGVADVNEQHIVRPGLFWDAWKHRLAVKLSFKPLGVNCAIGAAERQIAGSELAALAVASWQPVLCNKQGGAIYTISTGAESDAATSAATAAVDSPLALTELPLTGNSSLNYAPIALTGIVVSFAIDREPRTDSSVPSAAQDRAGQSFTSMNLTPRLLAKLLTNSYLDSLPTNADKTDVGFIDSGHPGPNARNLLQDPDFLAINDSEWKYQAMYAPSIADLLVPQGRSDIATLVWRYILSDPSAVAFLNSKADPWGMKVNPWNSTDAAVNPSGTALQLPRDGFPKSDPLEQAATGSGGPVNLVTWRPYVTDFDTSAYLTLRGDGQVLGAWDPTSAPPKYGKSVRDVPGYQKVLGLTDAPAASRYQVATANLLNPAGAFVGVTTSSLTAAAAAMTASGGQSQVYGFDPSSSSAKGAATAYPLATPVYAAANPALADVAVRKDYAAFIRYAVGDGQSPGTAAGQLPDGYAPLPAGWVAQAGSAATAIAAGATVTTSSDSGSGSVSTGSSFASGSPAGSADTTVPAPTASGSPAPSLTGAVTPKSANVGALPGTVPLSALAGLMSAALVPGVLRLRRRR